MLISYQMAVCPYGSQDLIYQAYFQMTTIGLESKEVNKNGRKNFRLSVG